MWGLGLKRPPKSHKNGKAKTEYQQYCAGDQTQNPPGIFFGRKDPVSRKAYQAKTPVPACAASMASTKTTIITGARNSWKHARSA